jgi:phosphohistidine phosphatase SixA
LLYLLRHGDAEEDHGEGDAARRLTPEGERQARTAGSTPA